MNNNLYIILYLVRRINQIKFVFNVVFVGIFTRIVKLNYFVKICYGRYCLYYYCLPGAGAILFSGSATLKYFFLSRLLCSERVILPESKCQFPINCKGMVRAPAASFVAASQLGLWSGVELPVHRDGGGQLPRAPWRRGVYRARRHSPRPLRLPAGTQLGVDTGILRTTQC